MIITETVYNEFFAKINSNPSDVETIVKQYLHDDPDFGRKLAEYMAPGCTAKEESQKLENWLKKRSFFNRGRDNISLT